MFGSSGSSSSSLFGSSQSTAVSASPGGGGGLFGSSTSSTGGGLFGKAAEAVAELDPACFYTPLDQLTDQERAAFSAAEFELGMVPTRPPPKELCF